MVSAQVESNWLTLGEASRLLGIHPTTLRAWVDAGILPAFLTPGGHRRFKDSELREFVSRRANVLMRERIAMPEKTMEQVRDQLRHLEMTRHPWYQRLSEVDKSRHRTTGARLLGLLLQFVGRQDNQDQFLSEARLVAREYGHSFASANSSVSELVQAFLLFRRMIVSAAYSPAAAGVLNDEEGLHLLGRINEFMDELLIATLDAFEQTSPRSASRESRVVNRPVKALRKPHTAGR